MDQNSGFVWDLKPGPLTCSVRFIQGVNPDTQWKMGIKSSKNVDTEKYSNSLFQLFVKLLT